MLHGADCLAAIEIEQGTHTHTQNELWDPVSFRNEIIKTEPTIIENGIGLTCFYTFFLRLCVFVRRRSISFQWGSSSDVTEDVLSSAHVQRSSTSNPFWNNIAVVFPRWLICCLFFATVRGTHATIHGIKLSKLRVCVYWIDFWFFFLFFFLFFSTRVLRRCRRRFDSWPSAMAAGPADDYQFRQLFFFSFFFSWFFFLFFFFSIFQTLAIRSVPRERERERKRKNFRVQPFCNDIDTSSDRSRCIELNRASGRKESNEIRCPLPREKKKSTRPFFVIKQSIDNRMEVIDFGPTSDQDVVFKLTPKKNNLKKKQTRTPSVAPAKEAADQARWLVRPVTHWKLQWNYVSPNFVHLSPCWLVTITWPKWVG